MFLFWVKKFVSFWMMPVPFCVLLLVIGWLLSRSARRTRLGRALMFLGIVLLLFFSNKFISFRLIHPLETVYPPIPEITASAVVPADLAACRYFVVLGAGNGETPGVAAINRLSTSARARVCEAVRLARLVPSAKVIFSGPGRPGVPSDAEVQAEAAVSLGLDRSRVLLVDYAHDTEDEANVTRKLTGDAPVGVVTSAWHMPRAMALMHHAGVRATPCPTDYMVLPAAERQITDYTWSVESIAVSTWAVKERIGYLWIWLRGKTK